MRRTDQVTKRIQELWVSMQDQGSQGVNRDTFVSCAERIRVAVAELTAIFPKVMIISYSAMLFSTLRNIYCVYSIAFSLFSESNR